MVPGGAPGDGFARYLTSRHRNDHVMMMRTTLTLDDDVAASLERLRRSQRLSLKQLVNEALRRGLHDMGKRRERRERVQTRAAALGRVWVASIDKVGNTLAIVEGENFK
jgi:Arc/MetJ family transcription regulator